MFQYAQKNFTHKSNAYINRKKLFSNYKNYLKLIMCYLFYLFYSTPLCISSIFNKKLSFITKVVL